MFKVKSHRIFVTMTDYHLKDINLSLQAKGLQSWFLYNRSDWNGNFSEITKFNVGLTESELLKVVNELIVNGYITVDKKTNTYTVQEKPVGVKDKDLTPIEISDTINNNNARTKETNLYQKCFNFINEYTGDEALRRALVNYLNIRFNPGSGSRLNEMRITYFNAWRDLVLSLDACEGNKVAIVEQSCAKHWAKFVDIKPNKTRDGVVSHSYTALEIAEFKKRAKELEEKGEKSVF